MSVQPAVQVRAGSPTAGKTVAMSSGPTNFQHRKILNRQNADAIQVLFEIPRAKKTPGLLKKIHSLLSCGTDISCGARESTICWYSLQKKIKKEAQDSDYAWVMENRIEINRPMIGLKEELCAPCCCKYEVYDNVRAYHFDKVMFDNVEVKYASKEGCEVMCLGSSGDRVSLKKYLCCTSYEVVGFDVPVGTGTEAAYIITTARDSARARMN